MDFSLINMQLYLVEVNKRESNISNNSEKASERKIKKRGKKN